MNTELTHITSDGTVSMVDVGDKPKTHRRAIAGAVVHVSRHTMDLLQKQALPKGDALACARIGAIMAAKNTSQLVPLCHPVGLTFLDVRFTVEEETIRIESEARAFGETGVEMEAIVAAQMAATIIYDMCKAVQRDIRITDVRLLYKSGGRSGEYRAEGFHPC